MKRAFLAFLMFVMMMVGAACNQGGNYEGPEPLAASEPVFATPQSQATKASTYTPVVTVNPNATQPAPANR